MSPDTSAPLVSFKRIQKSYDGETLVVKDLNLDIYSGEFLSLLGPSGSGKTTCLMMLAGFEYPTTGDIFLENQSINDVPAHKRNIGVVFQNYALFPHLTIEKNLEYPLKIRKIPAAERKRQVQEALAMVQMEGFSKRRPSQLSGGQQQRIALARALVFKPKLVLMDEPLGALDKQLREHMQLELKSLHQSLGITFVYVTHDQSEALTMSDRVAVFNHGVIQQVSSASELYESPGNRFVASFVGDSNQLSAVVESTDSDRCRVRLADGSVLDGLNIQALNANDDCVINIRPERLQVCPAGTENAISAVVTDKVYQGDHIRLVCKTAGQTTITVRQSVASDASLQAISTGTTLTLKATPEYTRVFTP